MDASIDSRWLKRGLKSFYVLDSARWFKNQVTGNIDAGSASAGTGPAFPNGWLQTTASNSNYAALEHGLALNIEVPVTFVWGYRAFTTGVYWSVSRTDVNTWFGFYADANGMLTANNNVFNGAAATLGNSAACVSSNRLVAASGRGLSIDTSFTVPTLVQNPYVYFGGSKRSTTFDNLSTVRLTHWGAFQGELSEDELLELASYPGHIFEPRTVSIPYASAAASTYTLSAATVTNITATSATPRVYVTLPA
jgi:hypothetical protein